MVAKPSQLLLLPCVKTKTQSIRRIESILREGLATIVEESEPSAPPSPAQAEVHAEKRHGCASMVICVCHHHQQEGAAEADGVEVDDDGDDDDHGGSRGAGCHFKVSKVFLSLGECYVHMMNSLVDRGNLGELSIFSSSGVNAFIAQPVCVRELPPPAQPANTNPPGPSVHVVRTRSGPGTLARPLNVSLHDAASSAVHIPITISLHDIRASSHRPVSMSLYDLKSLAQEDMTAR